jgi:hypothetical protein
MNTTSLERRLLATVDVRELNTLRWGPLRDVFPGFVEEIELGRCLKRLLSMCQGTAVQISPHRTGDGSKSTHVVDVFVIGESPTLP